MWLQYLYNHLKGIDAKMKTHKIDYNVWFPPAIEETIKTIQRNNGIVYLVGGAVRDIAMNNFNFKDYDFEVFNMQPETLAQLLNCKLSGNAFAVFNVILGKHEVQFSIPRIETKSGSGYKGFDVTFDPFMTVENAARRRDFTFNAIYINVREDLRNIIIDPFNGMLHLKQHKIVPVSNEAFIEDPVRILRAIQFAGRFGFEIEDYKFFKSAVMQLSNQLANEPSERIVIEINKLLGKSISSIGIDYLCNLSMIQMFNFIGQMKNTEHCEIYHKEGDVFVHTVKVMSKLIQLRNSGYEIDLSTMWAGLFHDYGKVYTSKFKRMIDGKKRITAIGHELKSAELFDNWCNEFAPQFDRVMRTRIKLLIANHMVDSVKIKELSVKHGKAFAQQLCLLIWSDQMGRIPNGTDKANAMVELYNWFNTNEIVPIVDGDFLKQLGYKEGVEFGKWLKILLKMQIEGTLDHSNVENRIKSVCGKI